MRSERSLVIQAMSGAVEEADLEVSPSAMDITDISSDIMIITVILLVVLVQIFQSVGMLIANKIDRRK